MKSAFGLIMLFASLLAGGVEASTRPLFAGQHQEIGEVETLYQGNQLVVSVQVTEVGWCLERSHLYVGESQPLSSAPGQFPYSHELGCARSDIYRVDVNAVDQYVAYHAESKQSSYPIGGTVSYSVKFPGGDSYFDATINGTGPFNAWCMDLERFISPGTTYTNCELRSLNDPDLGVVDKEQNLNAVSWILNQDWSQSQYSWQDIQGAIWKLTDDSNPTSPAGGISWNETNALAIVALAVENGSTYQAGSFEGLVLLCRNTAGAITQQITVVAVPALNFFIGEDTAWADGDSNWYNGKGNKIGWGTYWLEVYPTL
ncbi:hypothetical protein FJQ87_00350 [Shewanella sp. SNU WT4]|uniref:hypothetical protein n=1 Tax=Shewanella sp. SNU WT4 TaxID=2590015 RepID=UPI001126F3F2|nr:hypothetical protein [Shewanella sp. SNU WT4]QDF65333.1 hypothetical protein FJQ87_00350 [Shewanella sp. SNU WT4]